MYDRFPQYSAACALRSHLESVRTNWFCLEQPSEVKGFVQLLPEHLATLRHMSGSRNPGKSLQAENGARRFNYAPA